MIVCSMPQCQTAAGCKCSAVSHGMSNHIDQIALEAAREIEYFRWFEPARRVAATQVQIIKAIKACHRPEGER